MLRIAHLISTPTGIGGAERLLGSLVSHGVERGWQQVVLNPFARDPDSPSVASVCPPTVEVHGLAVRNWWDLPSARKWLGREISDFKPDVVHVHLFHALVLAAVTTGVRDRTNWILTHHHGSFLEVQDRRWERVLDRWAGTRMDLVVAVSNSVAEYLSDTYAYRDDRVAVIPNGWEGVPRPPDSADRAPTVVCVGNLRPEKGHDSLLRAFAKARETVTDAQLILVGDGPCAPSVRNLATGLGLDEAVTFAGAASDVWPWLARADVFAIASRVETFGIAALEAHAAGLPVVATDVGGVAEVVRRGETGILLEPGDIDGMAKALAELLLSPERRRWFASNAVQAAQNYRMENTVRAYAELYGSLSHSG